MESPQRKRLTSIIAVVARDFVAEGFASLYVGVGERLALVVRVGLSHLCEEYVMNAACEQAGLALAS